MKKIFFILFVLCLIYSCKKESINNNNILKGKLRTLTEYDDDNTFKDTITYYFIYDTINGDLQKIKVKYVNAYLVDTFGLDEWNIDKINDTTIIFKGEYKVIVNNKQIIRIYKYDTTSQSVVNLYSEVSKLDSNVTMVYDIGKSVLGYEIVLSDFKFENNNCTQYKGSWIDGVSGIFIHKSTIYNISYTSNVNNTTLQYQAVTAERTTLGTLTNFQYVAYFLGINGYYLVPPNKNLINTITDSIRGVTIKYNYQFANDKVEKLDVRDSNTNFVYNYNIMTYY